MIDLREIQHKALEGGVGDELQKFLIPTFIVTDEDRASEAKFQATIRQTGLESWGWNFGPLRQHDGSTPKNKHRFTAPEFNSKDRSADCSKDFSRTGTFWKTTGKRSAKFQSRFQQKGRAASMVADHGVLACRMGSARRCT